MALITSGQLALVDLNDVQAQPTQPSNATNGSLWYNTTNSQLYVYNGGSWNVSTAGLTLGGTNMVLNGDFSQGTTAGSSTAPTNWTFFGARTTIYSGQGNTNYNTPRTLYIGHDTVDSGIQQTLNGLQKSTQYTMSFALGKENINNIYAKINFYDASNNVLSTQTFNYDFTKSDTYQHFTFTTPATFDHAIFIHGGMAVTYGSSYLSRLGSVQLELGANASDWSPSPGDTSSQIVTINNYLNDLADDSKISRFERSLVRQQINDITGLWLNPTDSMPTLATIDSSGIGSLYAMRKAARDIGADTTPGTNYTNVGNNYTTLANYLNGLSPKPWDTALTDTASTPVTPATWNADWKAYNDSFNLLQIDVQDRQKAYTDTAASNAQSGAIAAVQNAAAHQTTNIVSPSFTINAPIATIGLPEFQGAHFDSWTWNGRNLMYNTGLTKGTTNFSLSSGITLDTTQLDGGVNSFYYNISGLAADAWRSANPTYVPVTVGQAYSASADIYIPAGATFDYGKPTLEIQWINSSGSRISAVNTSASYADLTKTNQWQTVTAQNMVAPTGAVTANARVWIQRNGTCWVSKLKLETGTVAHTWTPAPEDIWGTTGNRIRPITSPTFSTGTNLTMNLVLYGDGTNNDSVVWDSNGNLVRTKKWQDDNLNATQNWAFGVDATGYKQVKVPAYVVDVTNNTVQAVKHNGTMLTAVTSFTAADQVSLASSDNTLYLSIADTDSGWGETYTPTAQEIAAYFLGWRMSNGTYNTNYTAKREVDTLTITGAATAAGNLTIGLNGTNYTVAVASGDSTSTIATKIAALTYTGYSDSASSNVVTFTATQDITVAPTFSAGSTGVTATLTTTTAGDVKLWYPIGDTNTNRITSFANGVPTTASPAIGNTINYYQVVYQVGTPTQVTGYTYDGVLALIQGNNTVNLTYPSYTPSIATGTVKYATNLATSNQDLTYVIPTIQTRLASAESKVTNNAIVNTVTQSVAYQTALSGKADATDLSNYASQAALNATNNSVSGLNTTVNGINTQLSTFVTTTQETADIKGVKESFYQSGGMNLAYDSVGYAYNPSNATNFWTQYTSYNVTTVQNNDLYNLGFGSGWYYAPNGQNKGVTQDINVVPGQHYTLSWYLNKLTSGGDSSYRFYIQIIENGTIIQQIADNSGTKTNGYQASYMQYTASANVTKCTIRFIGYSNVEAYLSGIMFTIGDTPIPWTLATGETYNTNIRMNINGIAVSQLDANGNEIGYTQITPTEFAGYHTSNNGGTFEKVFYLNGDETVTKKITATNAITMGTIQILPINGATSKGWVFIPNN